MNTDSNSEFKSDLKMASLSSDLDDDIITTFKNGIYYNPASKHYSGMFGSTDNINVVCDRCGRTHLKVSIRYKNTDLCMGCVSELDSRLSNNIKPIQIKKPVPKPYEPYPYIDPHDPFDDKNKYRSYDEPTKEPYYYRTGIKSIQRIPEFSNRTKTGKVATYMMQDMFGINNDDSFGTDDEELYNDKTYFSLMNQKIFNNKTKPLTRMAQEMYNRPQPLTKMKQNIYESKNKTT